MCSANKQTLLFPPLGAGRVVAPPGGSGERLTGEGSQGRSSFPASERILTYFQAFAPESYVCVGLPD
jgi:hypothetical protein